MTYLCLTLGSTSKSDGHLEWYSRMNGEAFGRLEMYDPF